MSSSEHLKMTRFWQPAQLFKLTSFLIRRYRNAAKPPESSPRTGTARGIPAQHRSGCDSYALALWRKAAH